MKLGKKAIGAGCAVSAGLAAAILLGWKDDGSAAANRPSTPITVTDTYLDASGVQFAYPRAWKVTKRPDKDTLVKVSGGDGLGELSLSQLDNGARLQLTEWLKLIDYHFFSKLPDFREAERQYVLVGKSKDIPALSRQVRFSFQGIPIRQDMVLIPAGGTIYTLSYIEPIMAIPDGMKPWSQALSSLNMPDNLIAAAKRELPDAPTAKGKAILAENVQCDTVCPLVVTKRPNATMTLEQKVAAIVPRPEEERWLQIPWEPNLMLARAQAQEMKKPIFVWIMDGNVMGAT
jgi:hypothetical protein